LADVVVKDTLEGPQTREGIRTDPPVPFVSSGAQSIFNIGTLSAGQRGRIQIHSTLPITTPPGTVITNTVTITGSNDADPGNNTAVVTLTVPLLPPVIVSPQAGSTCTGFFTVAGMASPGATVHVFVDGIEVGTAIAGPAGRWALGVALPDGSHAIYAVAELGGIMSPPSPTVVIIVDSTLTWDPLSLRFIDADGNVLSPRDGSGRMDETGWMIRLRAHMTYTVRVRVCCEDPNATVTLDVPGLGEVSLTDADGGIAAYSLDWKNTTLPPLKTTNDTPKSKKAAPARTTHIVLRMGGKALSFRDSRRVITIGRDAGNDISVDNPEASRKHCRIVIQHESYVLVDQSTNGTYLTPDEGTPRYIKHKMATLNGAGWIAFGHPHDRSSDNIVEFRILGVTS
jgi:hypothetical protein